ncbi:hypothetical protein [Devosia salina]|uniref:Uncharacterized protein n=1 Tax=Devosia salina TaxID=2860336 RepID=A0ABX8WBL9_9HYPH|nr:hypothetical protein [Devosia salina]QYO76092.1 hypothetical protein K1X15_15930 [Devosia salina]
MAWLQDNAQAISAIASLGTLAIWSVYLTIFWRGYRRQLKPKLVINRGEGDGLDAHCLLTNMSQQAIHIQGVEASVSFGERTLTTFITDAEDVRAAGNPTGWRRLTRQGPLASGAMVDMGTFDSILGYVVAREPDAPPDGVDNATACNVTVLAIYGSEDLLVGATRDFDLAKTDEGIRLRPRSVVTWQIKRRSERRRYSRGLAKDI